VGLGELSQTAVAAARRARRELADAMATLQADEAARAAIEPLAQSVSKAVRQLFAAETRDATGILESMGSAIELLRQALADAQDETALPAVYDAAASLAASLTILYPAREELARSLTASTPADEEPVIPLERPRRVDDERRSGERVEIEAVIGFHTETNFFTGFSGDLSDGGLFIATWDLLPIGSELTLSFVLPEGRQIRGRARVSWVRGAPRSSDENHEPGMGVVFEDLGEADKAAVMRFIRVRAPLFYG
jgi:uncharacterized protein (TIGR02266 family)